jgi:hypothetical protein
MPVKTQQQKQSEAQERVLYKASCNVWKTIKHHKDVTILSRLAKVTTVTISKAINKGEGSLKVLRICDEFYNARKKELLKYANKEQTEGQPGAGTENTAGTTQTREFTSNEGKRKATKTTRPIR